MYKDPWILLLPFSKWSTFINIQVDVNSMMVSDFFNNNKEWDVPLMSNIFSTEIMNHISRLPTTKFNWPDQLVWDPNCTKTIKLKDIYTLIYTDGLVNELNIHWVWKLDVPLRVQFF